MTSTPPIITFHPISGWFRDRHMTSEGVVRVNLRTSADNTGTKMFSLCYSWMGAHRNRKQLEAICNQMVCWGLPKMKPHQGSSNKKWWGEMWFLVKLFELNFKLFKSFWAFQLHKPVNSLYKLSQYEPVFLLLRNKNIWTVIPLIP